MRDEILLLVIEDYAKVLIDSLHTFLARSVYQNLEFENSPNNLKIKIIYIYIILDSKYMD